jgi:hypothetical protein
MQDICNEAKNCKHSVNVLPPPDKNFGSLAGKSVFDWSGKMQQNRENLFLPPSFSSSRQPIIWYADEMRQN